MTRDRVAILVGLLVVLTGIAWIFGVFDSEFSTLDIPEWRLDANSVSAVSAKIDDVTIEVTSESGVWTLTSPIDSRADTMHVNRLINDIANVELSSVVSTNPARYGNYGVDSSASSVVLTASGEQHEVVIGKQTPDLMGSFVRVDSDPRVFTTARPVRLTADVDQWRDKVIVHVPVELIVSVDVTSTDGSSYRVDSESGEWMVESPGQRTDADSASVVQWIRRFAPLRGDGFIELGADLTPAGELLFATTSGSRVALEFFENESFLIIRRPDDRALLRVSKGRKSSLIPTSDTLQ